MSVRVKGKRVTKLPVNHLYDGTREVTGTKPGRTKWTDFDLLGHKAILLKELNDDEMIKEVKIFLNGISNRMTARSAASALLLTWNLRSTDVIEYRIFPDVDVGRGPDDEDIEDLAELEGHHGNKNIDKILAPIPDKEIRRAGAFLAASTLKMFAKSHSNWILGWENDHYQNRYKGFTKKEFPFPHFDVEVDEIEKMAEFYQNQKIFIGTLGRILYAGGEVHDARQIDMLYEQHLSYTGMHIVPQFINARNALGDVTGDLLKALDMGQNQTTLCKLRDLINSSLSRDAGPNNRATWRFSRLFDQKAFPMLQTKQCQDTVAILANLNNLAKVSTDTSNPLEIAVLKQMGAKRKQAARIVAERIFEYFTRGSEDIH